MSWGCYKTYAQLRGTIYDQKWLRFRGGGILNVECVFDHLWAVHHRITWSQHAKISHSYKISHGICRGMYFTTQGRYTIGSQGHNIKFICTKSLTMDMAEINSRHSCGNTIQLDIYGSSLQHSILDPGSSRS